MILKRHLARKLLKLRYINPDLFYTFKTSVLVMLLSFAFALPLVGILNFIFASNLRNIDYVMLGTAFQSIILILIFSLKNKN